MTNGQRTCSAFVDESGDILSGKPFAVGLFITWREQLWRDIVYDAKRDNGFIATLHFSQLSRNPNDPRIPVYRQILTKLGSYCYSWYGRRVYASGDMAKALKDLSNVDAYDLVMTAIVMRFIPKIYSDHITLVIADRSRPALDDYLPAGLERHLNRLSVKYQWGKTFSVRLTPARQDGLLQVADLFASTYRQLKMPSENPNKAWLASEITAGNRGERIVDWEITPDLLIRKEPA